jgi:hypothetical protein
MYPWWDAKKRRAGGTVTTSTIPAFDGWFKACWLFDSKNCLIIRKDTNTKLLWRRKGENPLLEGKSDSVVIPAFYFTEKMRRENKWRQFPSQNTLIREMKRNRRERRLLYARTVHRGRKLLRFSSVLAICFHQGNGTHKTKRAMRSAKVVTWPHERAEK